MSIYNVNGSALSMAYKKNGISSGHAYDATGNQIWGETIITYPLKVMTYNVQKFTSLNGNSQMQSEIVSLYDPDIIGFQEFSGSASLPSVARTALSDYADIQFGPSMVSYVAMASKEIPLQGLTTGMYTTQKKENRGWMKAYIPLHGVMICIANTHLEVSDTATRYAQLQELMEILENEEYLVILGDFNHYSYSTASADWTNMYGPLLEAGYHISNCKNDNDFNWTFTNQSVGNVLQGPNAPDNVITSANIDIVATHYDMTKFDYVTTQNIDHIPMVCELSVKITL